MTPPPSGDSVRAWLHQLALEQYSQVFAENDVDLDTLPLLGEADLEKLGVSLGHRKRMLRAIAELNQAARPAGSSGGGPVSRPAEGSPAATGTDVGERRHLTVLFCDMVGYTELANRVDPEVLQTIIHAYEDACAACVERYEGYVFQRLGDGIVAFFGYPRAHEDEAERAIRAALDIIDTLGRMDFAEAGHIAVRIGIASGLVVVLSAEKGAVGDTMVIASRLQGIAESDTIAVSERVHRLAGARFDYLDLGPRALKGIAAPVGVWRVTSLGRSESRFQAIHGAPLTPIIGREAEVEVLHDCWQRVVDGQGQVVAIGGEAGIGKSRLARIIIDETRGDPAVWVSELQCSPFHTLTAFYPIAERLRQRLFRDLHEGDHRGRWAALEAYLRGTSLPVDEALPLIADLLAVTPPAGEPLPPITPERARTMTRHFLVSLLIDQAEAGPGIVLLEDLHWADPSTLDLVDFFIERMREARILVLLTHRPEFARAMPSAAYVRGMTLARLRSEAASELVRLRCADHDFATDVLRQVIEKTDGVPLYIEEFVKSVVESRQAAATAAMSQVVIPQSLHDSLLARLDHLGEAKAVAQLAAMLGREFRRDVLEAVWTGTPDALIGGLARLAEAEFIFPVGGGTRERYIFKHALIQDAAYESLLKSHRATHHRRIAEVIEQQFSEVVADQPELVAHHYAQGKHPERAAHFWLHGGQRSLRRNAHVEAAAHLRSALSSIAELPETPARTLSELDVQIALGTALVAASGYASSDVEAAWTRAQDLCTAVGDVPQRVPALFGLWMFETVRANHPAGLELSRTIVQLAEAMHSEDLLIEAHLGMGISRFFLGQFDEACRSFDLLLGLYDVEKHGAHRFQFGQDPASIALVYLNWIRWIEGDCEAADAMIARAIELTRGLDHPFTLSFVLAFAAWQRLYAGEPERADPIIDRLITLCTDEQIPVFLAHGLAAAGWARCAKGEADGPEAMSKGLAVFTSTGSRCFLPYWNAFRADALSARGDHGSALAILDESEARMEATSERWAEPELYRLRGRVLERSGAAPADAEACYRRALECAGERGLLAWQLRAATSLAGLLHGQGRADEARAVLDRSLNNRHPRFEGRDLRDARLQLESLPI